MSETFKEELPEEIEIRKVSKGGSQLQVKESDLLESSDVVEGQENLESEPDAFLIHTAVLTKEQIQSLGKIFDNLNEADRVVEDPSRKNDKEYKRELDRLYQDPQKFHMSWRYGRYVMSHAPQYPRELLNLGGNWLIAENEHTKDIILEELEGRGVAVLEVKKGLEGEVLDDLDQNVVKDIRDRLDRSKRVWLKRFPGSPRH